MIDIHCHILPKIDDGAENVKISIAMAAMAQQRGTKGIVATPHVIEGKWLPAWEDIVAKCEMLNQVLQEHGVTIPIYPGAEVGMNMDTLELIDGPGPYCINGSRYMLVELPAREIPNYTDDFFFMLQAKGITPVLAHPERYPLISKRPELIAEWINKGIMMQINGLSLSGRMGTKVKDMAELFLFNNMVHLVASDAHSTRTRNTDLTDAVTRINGLVGKDKAQKMFVDYPTRIISDQEISLVQHDEKIEYPKEPSLLRKVFSFFK